MAIKGLKVTEVVSVFNPTLNAYHEVSVPLLTKQLEALGFTTAEITARIASLKEKQKGEEE
jgi:hypothetical protein